MSLTHTYGYQNVNSKVSVEYLAERYLENWRANPSWNLKAFGEQIVRDLGVQVSYQELWHARHKAMHMIHGHASAEYARVWDYANAIRKYNPGSSAFVLVENVERPPPLFQRMYICLQACKEGFVRGCRPIIGVDGCHLKGAFPGQCLTAVGKDGNNNIYPIAWAVVEVENAETWTWFLDLLVKDIGSVEEHGWTFMSDKQKGLLEAFNRVVPLADTRYCVRHMWANFKLSFPGQTYKDSFWKAARASTQADFDAHMNAIKILSTEAHAYLHAVPPKHWSRHAFSTRSRSSMLLNNICETFNKVLKEVRDKPILTQMEWMRRYVMKRYYSKREGVKKYHETLMPFVKKSLEKAVRESRNCMVTQSSIDEFEVQYKDDTFIVDLKGRTCGCFIWDLSGIPCHHVCACILKKRLKVEDYVDDAYSKRKYMLAYEPFVHAMPGIKHWEKTNMTQPAPPSIKMPGRLSSEKRRKEAGEDQERFVKRAKKQNKCSRCGQYGHNKTTCNNTPLPQNPTKDKGGRPPSQTTWAIGGREQRARMSKVMVTSTSDDQGVQFSQQESTGSC